MAEHKKSKKHDVMISYNWNDSKPTVLKIRDKLKENGITYWIDVEHMRGSTLAAMSEAVENCTIFLMCYSSKYYESRDCFKEAEYAYIKEKIIIPCKMERGYVPSGWLGLLLGKQLFFEFSEKYPFEDKIKELLREIKCSLETDESLSTEIKEGQENRKNELYREKVKERKQDTEKPEKKQALPPSTSVSKVKENTVPDVKTSFTAVQDKSKRHYIMISYNWGNQKTVLQIREKLEENGIACRMDMDNMEGSILEAVAAAIENCTIFLMCYSQKYKDSQNCRTEAEYAYFQRKIIIPCRMEQGYKPSGWLEHLIGTKLIYDFSGKYPLDDKIKELLLANKSNLKTD